MTVTPTSCLRIAEALPEDAANFPIIRELKAALAELIALNAVTTKDPS